MTRLIEQRDTYRDEAELVEPAFKKAMLRIDRLADGDKDKRQRLLVELIEWCNSELDGEVLIITYEAVSK